jgi:hypothetical protein
LECALGCGGSPESGDWADEGERPAVDITNKTVERAARQMFTEFFSRWWRARESKVHGTTGKNKERPEIRDQRPEIRDQRPETRDQRTLTSLLRAASAATTRGRHYSKRTERKSEGAEEVADGFGGVEEGSAADFLEAKARVEGVGDGIRRDEIDFADDAGLAGRFGAGEEFGVEGAGVTFAACGGRDDDSVYVNEVLVGDIFLASCKYSPFPRKEPTEPAEIFVFVRIGLVKGDEQAVGVVDGGREKGCVNDLVEFGEGEWGEFDGVGVVEGEERLGGGEDLVDFGVGGHGRGTLYYGGKRERRTRRSEDRRPETGDQRPGNSNQ